MNIKVFRGHDVEVSPGRKFRVGNPRDESRLRKEFGIARLEEVRERANESARKRKESRYELSEDTKRLHGYIKSHGVNHQLIEKRIPQYLRSQDASRQRDKIQVQTSR